MKKEVIGTIVFVLIIVSIVVYGFNRLEKINNGEMIVVNENQMNR